MNALTLWFEKYRVLALAIGAAVALAVAFGAGFAVNGWRLGTKLSDLKAERAKERADGAEKALTTLKEDAAAIHTAATEFTAIQNTLGPKFDALKREIKNAKPLPAGCAPDADRVRNLDSAIDAANAATTGR